MDFSDSSLPILSINRSASAGFIGRAPLVKQATALARCSASDIGCAGVPGTEPCAFETHAPKLGQPPAGAVRFSFCVRPVMHW